MAATLTYDAAHDEVERMEAEYGGELPELSDPTLAERAQRLLDSGEALPDADEAVCRRVIDGDLADE